MTAEDIGKAYRKMVLKCHQDKAPTDPRAARAFRILGEARDGLLNPVEREALASRWLLRAPIRRSSDPSEDERDHELMAVVVRAAAKGPEADFTQARARALDLSVKDGMVNRK